MFASWVRFRSKESTPESRAPHYAGRVFYVGIAALAVIAVLLTVRPYFLSREHIFTADATVRAPIVAVGAQITGKVDAVLVHEQERVNAGQVLVRIDARAFQEDADRARAVLDQAEAVLHQTLAGSRDGGPESSAAARAAVAFARAKLSEALLSLERTSISAPMPAYVGKAAVEVGQFVQRGQELMVLVGRENLSVIANIKETQIARVHPGQQAEIFVQGRGEAVLGHVESIAPATAARLGLLPPEEAIASYGKVVQKIPVTIVPDSDSAESVLHNGMLVEVRILPKG